MLRINDEKGEALVECDNDLHGLGELKLREPLEVLHVGAGEFHELTEWLQENRHAAKYINVSEKNQDFCGRKGMLYTKDGKTMLFCPAETHGRLAIPEGTEMISEYAIRDLDLEYLYVPANVCPVTVMMYCRSRAFVECRIGEVEFGEGAEEIGGLVFAENVKIKKLIFPKSLRRIGRMAFLGCGIEELALNDGLEEICENAFAGCPIKEIRIPASVRKIDSFGLGADLQYVEPKSEEALYSFLRSATGFARCKRCGEKTNTVTIKFGEKKIAMPCRMQSAAMTHFLKRKVTHLFDYATTDESAQDTALAALTLNRNDKKAREFVSKNTEEMAKRYAKEKDLKNLELMVSRGLAPKDSLRLAREAKEKMEKDTKKDILTPSIDGVGPDF